MSLQTVNFDTLRLRDEDRILDLGCGEGRHAITAYMLKNVESVGIDLSLDDLQTTKQRFCEFADSDNTDKSLVVIHSFSSPSTYSSVVGW